LVIFTSDHGPAFVRAKTTAYDAGIHVPLLISGPGIAADQVSDDLVSLVDLAPTILEYAGLEPQARLHGKSLVPVLRGTATLDRQFLYAEMNFHGLDTFAPRRSLLDTRGFHLIHNLVPGRLSRLGIDGDTAFSMVSGRAYDGTSVQAVFDRCASPPEFELYSLADDPNEFENLADDPKMRQELELLQRELIRTRTDLGDPLVDEDVVQGYLKQSMGGASGVSD
jgi:N-sulfoglucosamine sulfohydrolase